MSKDTIATMASARQTVLGVLTARMNDDIEGTTLMVDTYVRESCLADQVAGRKADPGLAWAQLFAASVLLMIPLLECRAAHHEEDPAETLAELGLALAEFRNTYGPQT